MCRFLTPILICVAAAAAAQQERQFSMYMLNPYAYNPACAGLENSLIVTGVYRRQWTDLNGAPESQHLNAHLPVYFLRSGVGLQVDNDVVGAHQTARAKLTWSYQMEIGRTSLLSVGVSGGFQQYSLDGAKLRAPDGIYEPTPGGAFDHNDPNLPQGKVQAGAAVFDFGIFFQGEKLELGAAAQPVFSPVLKFSDVGNLQLVQRQHYLATAAWRFEVGKNLVVKPGLLVKSDFAATQIEISTIFKWADNMMTGASFRGIGRTSEDAAVLLAGMRLNEKTTVAYSFDLPLSPLKAANRGSHEILIRYNLNKPIGVGKLPPVTYNPRFQ